MRRLFLSILIAATLLPTASHGQLGAIFARAARGAARASDDVAETEARSRAAPRSIEFGSVTLRGVPTTERAAQLAEQRAALDRSFTVTDESVHDGGHSVEFKDVAEWALDLGLEIVGQTDADAEPDPALVEIAASRLAYRTQYWPTFCPVPEGFVLVETGANTCDNGSEPIVATAPLNISAVPIKEFDWVAYINSH